MVTCAVPQIDSTNSAADTDNVFLAPNLYSVFPAKENRAQETIWQTVQKPEASPKEYPRSRLMGAAN